MSLLQRPKPTNKILEIQSLVVDFDMVAVTETWLKQEIMNCELLPRNSFKITIVQVIFM